MTFLELIDRLDRWGRQVLNIPCRPMRREDPDGELVIEREEPHEDDREYGSPVG